MRRELSRQRDRFPHEIAREVPAALHVDPEHQKVLDQLDQELWYRSSEDYAKYARETLQRERALIERLGLLAK